MIPEDCKSVANHLQESGFVNYALGKWDHTPLYEVSQVGPFNRWPSGEGFDHFYGFMAADAHCFMPVAFDGHTPIEPWIGKDDYILEADMADKAIEYIIGHESLKPDLPWMTFWAPVAMHSPHHAPKSYIDAYTFTDEEAPNQRTEQLYELFGNRAIYKDGWKAVTIHANRMPWDLNKVLPFESDVWELYNLQEDFSEANDLADQYPEKLEELKARWDELAEQQQVYPLHDDMIMRLARQQDRIFGDQKEFVYHYPGARRIAEKASAPVKNRAHTIETTIDLKGDEEGVIVACGAMTGGYTMYIKDRRVHYDYNYFDGVYWKMSAPLPIGKTDIKFNFIKTGNFEGKGEMYVNGKLLAKVDMPTMHIATFSLSETFDVGEDTGTPVSNEYTDHFHFKGDLKKVVVTLTD